MSSCKWRPSGVLRRSLWQYPYHCGRQQHVEVVLPELMPRQRGWECLGSIRPGLQLDIKLSFQDMITRSWDRLIFIMGVPIVTRWHHCMGTVPMIPSSYAMHALSSVGYLSSAGIGGICNNFNHHHMPLVDVFIITITSLGPWVNVQSHQCGPWVV